MSPVSIPETLSSFSASSREPSPRTNGSSTAGAGSLGRKGARAGLARVLDALDRRLREAMEDAERRFGATPAADPYRGL